MATDQAGKPAALPNETPKFPGKMDHATALCLRVTHFRKYKEEEEEV
jgi:hypothetical protein